MGGGGGGGPVDVGREGRCKCVPEDNYGWRARARRGGGEEEMEDEGED